MSDWTASAPTDFRELLSRLPDGVMHSDRVLQPLLQLRRSEGGFTAGLAGTRSDRNGERRIAALSLRHNWVLDGSVVRPLPADVAATVVGLLGTGGTLQFAEIVRLLSVADPPLRIVAEQSVFTPAKSEAQSFDGELVVDGLQATLFPYQARGIRWMHETIRHTGGLILADEMGLGKTIQIIALLLLEPPSARAPALIVCPTTLIANWRKEIIKFGPELSLMIHRGGHRTEGNLAMFAGNYDDIAQTAGRIFLVANEAWRAWDLRRRR